MKPFLFLIGLAFGLSHWYVWDCARNITRANEQREYEKTLQEIAAATDNYAALMITDCVAMNKPNCTIKLQEQGR